jgi:riboflavin synthase alpha subunit
VQGHIDCTANIVAFEESDSRLEIGLPQQGARYLAEKDRSRLTASV